MSMKRSTLTRQKKNHVLSSLKPGGEKWLHKNYVLNIK